MCRVAATARVIVLYGSSIANRFYPQPFTRCARWRSAELRGAGQPLGLGGTDRQQAVHWFYRQSGVQGSKRNPIGIDLVPLRVLPQFVRQLGTARGEVLFIRFGFGFDGPVGEGTDEPFDPDL